VGLRNYKYFLLFLLWVSVCAVLYAAITGFAMLKAFKVFGAAVGAWSVLSLFITGSFALSVGGFFAFHLHLLRENRTTLENLKWRRDGRRGGGRRRERQKDTFADVFGEVWYLWFVPVDSNTQSGYEVFEDGSGDSVGASLIRNEYCQEEEVDGVDGVEEESQEVVNSRPLPSDVEMGTRPTDTA